MAFKPSIMTRKRESEQTVTDRFLSVEAERAAMTVRQTFGAFKEAIANAMRHGINIELEVAREKGLEQVEDPESLRMEMSLDLNL